MDETADTADSGPFASISLDSDGFQRFLIGFLVAAALFFVEAGIAEILLASNSSCLEGLSQMRLSPNPAEYCMSELGSYLAGAVSHALFHAGVSKLLVWPSLAVVYGLFGGAFAQLDLRRGVAGYLILHVLLLAAFTSITYLSQFIVR